MTIEKLRNEIEKLFKSATKDLDMDKFKVPTTEGEELEYKKWLAHAMNEIQYGATMHSDVAIDLVNLHIIRDKRLDIVSRRLQDALRKVLELTSGQEDMIDENDELKDENEQLFIKMQKAISEADKLRIILKMISKCQNFEQVRDQLIVIEADYIEKHVIEGVKVEKKCGRPSKAKVVEEVETEEEDEDET